MATAAVAKTVQKHHTCPALASTQTPKTTPTHPTPQSCICLPPPPHPVNPTFYQSSVYPRLVTMHGSDVTCCSVGVVLLSPASPPPTVKIPPPHPPGHNLSAPNCFYSLMHESDVTRCRVGAALLRPASSPPTSQPPPSVTTPPSPNPFYSPNSEFDVTGCRVGATLLSPLPPPPPPLLPSILSTPLCVSLT